MNGSDSAPSPAISSTRSNSFLESSRGSPPSPQPSPYDWKFSGFNSSRGSSEIHPESASSETSNGSAPKSTDSFALAIPPVGTEIPPKKSAHSHASSLTSMPANKQAYQKLKHTLSFPTISYQSEKPDDPSLTAKYRPLTRSPWDGSDVRWYFCQTTLGQNEVAASVPQTELVGKGEYFRFSKGDSDALEAAFLEREEELVRAWWKEYAESGEGPSGATYGNDSNSASGRLSEADGKDFESGRNLRLTAPEEEENVGVLVKGGLYEVDLLSRRCSPVYWRGDHRRVLRGHWFARKGGLDWLPLREDISEQLEIAYQSQIWRRRRFQPSGLYAARYNLHGGTQGLHALFTGEDDSWEAWLCVDRSGISFVLGIRGSGVKLRRGFTLPESVQPTQDELRQQREEAMDDYASKVPVRHVVFMVHGIGQRLEKANLVDDVGTFRRAVAMLAEQHLTQYQLERQRILFIPCQWRRGLKLGGESTVEDCTLEGVRALRTMLSATVHDVLYYMSPVYCQDIIDSVSHSLNRLYGKFLKRNPNYDGKVSIYGHSLGSVLSYDILCHQNPEALSDVAPIADVGQNPEDSPSSITGSESEHEESLQGDFDDTLRDDRSPVSAESANSRKVESSHTGAELEYSTQQDELLQNYPNKESSQIDVTEVEALKAKVKMLQDKLSDLMEEKSVKDGSIPLSASSSGEHATFEAAGNCSSDGMDKKGGGLENGQEIDKECTFSKGESSTGDKEKSYMDRKFSSKKHFTPHISYTKLDFEVETFYAVGSPLGVFLSLRNIRIGIGMGQEYWQNDGVEEEIPAVRQMMNIFHPYDPVAYRMEPLICREFTKMRPKFVPYHKGGKRWHIGMQEFQEDLSTRSKAIVNSFSSVGTRVVHALSANTYDKTAMAHEEASQEKTYGALMMERLTGGPGGRLDYQLQDSTFEHQYIAVLSSHTAYWHDLDTALFILKHLYRDVPREAPTPAYVYRNEETGLGVIREDSEIPELSGNEESAEVIGVQDAIFSGELAFTFMSKDAIAAAFADANKVKADWMG